MISIIGAHLVVKHHGQTTTIQRCTQQEYYTALVIFGVRSSAAEAAAKGLITVKLKAAR